VIGRSHEGRGLTELEAAGMREDVVVGGRRYLLGRDATGWINVLKANISQFRSSSGEAIILNECDSSISRMHWNGSGLRS
jgi:hypothetical protein